MANMVNTLIQGAYSRPDVFIAGVAIGFVAAYIWKMKSRRNQMGMGGF